MNTTNAGKATVPLTSNLARLYQNAINEVLHGIPKQKVEWLGQDETAILAGLHERLVRVEPGITPVIFELSDMEYDLLKHALGVVIEGMDPDEFHTRIGVFKSYAKHVSHTMANGQPVVPPLIRNLNLTVGELAIVSDAVEQLCRSRAQDFLHETGASQHELSELAIKILSKDERLGDNQGHGLSLSYDELTALLHAMRLCTEIPHQDVQWQPVFRKLLVRASGPITPNNT